MLGFGCVDLLAALMVGGMVLSMGLEVGSDALRQLLRARGAASAGPAAAGPAAVGGACVVARRDEVSLPHLGVPASLLRGTEDPPGQAEAGAATGRTAHDR